MPRRTLAAMRANTVFQIVSSTGKQQGRQKKNTNVINCDDALACLQRARPAGFGRAARAGPGASDSPHGRPCPSQADACPVQIFHGLLST